MKHTKVIIKRFACISVLLVVSFSCKHKEEYHGIMDKIESESAHYEGVTLSSESFIDGIETIKIYEDGHSFLIPERKSQMTSYKCTECHVKPIGDLEKDGSVRKAHWNIDVNHADSKTMNCATCHNLDYMDNLTSLTGQKIDFNRSYNLCSQCHTHEFEDWKGGAHGKRIGGWAPPRASMTCVNCHNPHDPHIASKWPARFNTQKVLERE